MLMWFVARLVMAAMGMWAKPSGEMMDNPLHGSSEKRRAWFHQSGISPPRDGPTLRPVWIARDREGIRSGRGGLNPNRRSARQLNHPAALPRGFVVVGSSAKSRYNQG